MPKTLTKKARFLHEKCREYRGQRQVADYKTLVSRIERRAIHQQLSTLARDTER